MIIILYFLKQVMLLIINGRDKNILLKTCKRYKNLFPNELKSFKIKFNATEKEL